MMGREKTMPQVICFGEMVWDFHGEKKMAGGAPLNVGLHLQQLGLQTRLFSALGADALGNEFMKILGEHQEFLADVQVHPHLPTGKVVVDSSILASASYEIMGPSAWDEIHFQAAWIPLLEQSSALLFGSLACRNTRSYQTLLSCLSHSNFGVFDINLRPPFVDYSKIGQLMEFAHLLKINEEELISLLQFFCPEVSLSSMPAENLSLWMQYAHQRFPTRIFCLTLGDKGAMVGQEEQIFYNPGYKVKVQDTVGAGDAFLAGFLFQLIKGETLSLCLDYGCALGALVASKEGGTPSYREEEIWEIAQGGTQSTHS
jgi:fructokinase